MSLDLGSLCYQLSASETPAKIDPAFPEVRTNRQTKIVKNVI